MRLTFIQIKHISCMNSFPYHLTPHLSNFKQFADDKFTVARMMEFISGTKENIVGKGDNEKCWSPAFSTFP